MFERQCPKCQKTITYKDKNDYNKAVRRSVCCSSCSRGGIIFPDVLSFPCPRCGQERIYKTKGQYSRALRKNSKCQSCSLTYAEQPDHQWCSKCQKELPKEKFSRKVSRICMECSARRHLDEKDKDLSLYLLKVATRRAKRRGWECTITVDDIPVPSHCPYLGIPLFYIPKKTIANTPSIDRIDSTKGYIPGNVIICSNRANTIKNNAIPEELIALAKNLQKILIKE